MRRSNWGGQIAIPELKFVNPLCFLLFSLAGCFLILGVSGYIQRNAVLARAFAFIGEHSLSILLFNMLLRKIYFLLLFRLEHPGVNFHAADMRSTLHWWDSLGCTVFMVVAPVCCILLKRKTKSVVHPLNK